MIATAVQHVEKALLAPFLALFAPETEALQTVQFAAMIAIVAMAAIAISKMIVIMMLLLLLLQ